MYESMVTFTTLLLSEVVKIIFFESFLALSRFTFVHNYAENVYDQFTKYLLRNYSIVLQ